MKLRVGLVTVALLGASSMAASSADRLLKDAVPQKWFQPYLPEDLPKLDVPKYIQDSPIDFAEAQAFAGRYRAAVITLMKAPDADPVRAALVRGVCYWRMGQTDQALAAMVDAKVADDPRVQVQTAEVLADTGKHAEAIAILRKHLAANPDSIAGHYQLGHTYELAGDVINAREAYAWFVTAPHNFFDLWAGQARSFDDAAEVTLIAKAMDRDAVLNSKYKDTALHNFILNMFVKAYDVIDRTYYPARIAAAEFMLSRSNEEKAYELLQQANAVNPRHPDVDRMMGELMLKASKFNMVEACVDSMRDVNPSSIDADVLEARLQLSQKQRQAAEATLNKVVARDPRRFDALGLLAGLQYSVARDADAEATLKKADAVDSNQWQAYLEAGDVLFRLHQLRTSLQCLKTAVERAPWSVEARNALGNVYLQSGDDENARAALDAAYTVDPFNVATVNYLKLLDQTAKFLKTETDHFIFVYDTPDDPIVPLYIAPEMEKAYKEVTGPLHFEPPQKTIIQIYPDADTFSVRMSGVPGLESFAFTFGRLIVSAAPRAGQNVGTFNFARVIKHEFAHTCHLTMTDGRVPRWLTEGLAVMSEQVDFRFDWVPEELYKRATAGKLFKIADLDQVFTRPKGQHDGEMAYMSGFWISRYMIETAGPESINKLLLAYKEGKTDDEAFKIATGQSVSEFEPKYFEWAKKQVEKWGYDKESAEKYKKAFDHGEAMLKPGKLDDAWTAFSEANQLQPMNQMPHRRLAAIAMRQKKPDDALTHLRWLIPLEFRDDRFAKSIAGLYQQLGDVPKATEFAELAVKTDPYDPLAHDLLGELYQKAGNELANRETEVAALLRQRKEDAEKAKNAPPKNQE